MYSESKQNSLMDNGMEKRAPPPVPTHSRPEMTARDEICRGESVRKAWPTRGDEIRVSWAEENVFDKYGIKNVVVHWLRFIPLASWPFLSFWTATTHRETHTVSSLTQTLVTIVSVNCTCQHCRNLLHYAETYCITEDSKANRNTQYTSHCEYIIFTLQTDL